MAISVKTKLNIERRISGALCVLFASLLVQMANPAFASKPLTTAQINVYESADEGQRVHFLIERAKMGQSELVETLLRRYPLQGPHAINRTLFIQGLTLESHGDLTGAAQKYRQALARDPSLTLVRVQLAQTLEKLGQDDSAKHHLQLLEAEAPTPQVAGNIRSFIERIDAKRPLTFSGFVSVAPSTNINSGSSHTKVYAPAFGNDAYFNINAADQEKSGVGIAAGASVGYSKRLGNHWEAVVAADISSQIYASSVFDSYNLSQSVEMRYHLNNGYIGWGGVADQSVNLNVPDVISDSLTYHSYGPRASLLRFLGDHSILHASAVYEWRDYANSTQLDGSAFLSEASFNHGFDQTFNVTVSAGYDKVNSNLKHISYDTWFGGMGFYKELPYGINMNGNAQARLSSFDDINPIFLETRKDQRYLGSLELTKRDLNFAGFAPSLAYTYTRNVSNIAAFDYDAHAVDFRLTKDF
jgi:outer membrane protein